MVKKLIEENKFTIPIGIILIILAGIIYFFLGTVYKVNLISRAFISLISISIFYIAYKKSLRRFNLTVLTGFTFFIAIESVFSLGLWISYALALSVMAAFWGIYHMTKNKERYPLFLLVAFIIVWIILAMHVKYRDAWMLENVLTIPFALLIYYSHRLFKLSHLSYTLIYIFMVLHIVGAHYTYAEVPFGFWLERIFNLSRNHFDHIVHFSFGLLLAYPCKEIMVRIGNLKGFWALSAPVGTVLALSAVFELLEWAAAIVFGGDLGVAYLGMQGDVWDAHWDMFLAGVGSIITMGLVFLFYMVYNQKPFLKELKESLSVKRKEVMGEHVFEKLVYKVEKKK